MNAKQGSGVEIKPKSRGPGNLCFLRSDESSGVPHLDWLYCSERLSGSDCRDIIVNCRKFSLIPPSTVGEDRYPAHRQAYTRKVQVNARTMWIFDLLCRAGAAASRAGAGLKLTEINREPQYVEYVPGWGRFDWHNDYSHELPDAPRKLTIIIQLSPPEDYDGGRLQVFGTEVQSLPREQGTVVAFPSFLFHRVTPVTRGVRRALVAWIAGPRLR
jgi:PKHD-type hydroxylase